MHYKDSQNKLYWLEAGEDPVRWLPKGCIAISDEEAEALRPVPPPPTVQDQLAQLDADNALTQRNLRETVMLMAEAFKQLSGGAVDMTKLPGVAKVFEVEAQAAELRAQI